MEDDALKTKILVCDPVHEEGIEKLKQAGFEVDVNPTITPEQLTKIVSNYDALIVRSRTKVTKEIIEAGRRLRAIGRAGAGLDNIDLETAKQRGITVLSTPEALAEAVAELTIGLIISLARSIPLADRTLKEGKWIKKKLMGWQLEGKTLGTIGLGNVGERVAKIAKALGMKILITEIIPLSPELLKELETEVVPLKELLQRSDVVTLHVPLTSQTYHMIGAKEFQLMKKEAFLVNTSRGAIVDEKALLTALKSGKIGGAALDVYEVEPPRDLELIKLPNVVCTAHIGAQTKEAQNAAASMIAEKIINSLK
ncbi:hydroxyacid dehydrogenase [Candidatus Bathyarchaeota archaeon]|nr:hydroxyacid dehydrogenase [Candidatus Bathyarchaeota archaeon]